METSYLRVSEHFFSIQGEGLTAGTRSVFLRLQGCDFYCNGKMVCDTIEVWKKGKPYFFPELLTEFIAKGYTNELKKGAHLILTGGNPLLQEKSLVSFIFDYLYFEVGKVGGVLRIEVETQGSLAGGLLDEVSWSHNLPPILWNVSPKLSNTGIDFKKRVNVEVLKWYNTAVNSIFKFPVTGDDGEIEEIRQIQDLVSISSSKIWLMPVCSTRKELGERSEKIANLAIKHGYNFSPRLQLLIWDQTTGV